MKPLKLVPFGLTTHSNRYPGWTDLLSTLLMGIFTPGRFMMKKGLPKKAVKENRLLDISISPTLELTIYHTWERPILPTVEKANMTCI